MSLQITNNKYYPALDGLRGVAILLVVFHHNFKFMNYFFFGWLGVDLFFVLSGFLITDILLNTVGKPHSLRNFYMRRVLRIFPLYYFILIIILLILPHIKSLNLNLSYYTTNQVWLWTYLQNWLYVYKEPFGSQIPLHLWSLALEEQFYLIWPATILLIRKPRILLVFVATVLLLVIIGRCIIWTCKVEGLAYANLFLFTRVDGICVGCLLALLLRINSHLLKKYATLIIISVAILNFGFYFLNQQHAYELPYLAFVGYTTFAMLFGVLVYVAVTDKSKMINFLFNNQILKFFGKISYGLYVYHWPIYLLLFPFFQKIFIGNSTLSNRIANIASSVIVTIIGIAISVISYRYFESYFLKLKNRFITKKTRVIHVTNVK